MSKNKLKRMLGYIFIPIIMAVIGYGVLYAALHPVINMASNILGMVISDSAPDFESELKDDYDKNAKRVKDGNISMTDVDFPSYESHYAQLSCSRLGMDVKIFWGDTDRVFKEGAGQYIGSFLPGYGDLILLGAHDSMYFEKLEYVEKGDVFTIYTNYGEFSYKVTNTKVASDKDREVFDDLEAGEQLVMYTCYPFGALIGVKNQRYYVFAEKISGPTIEQK